MPNPLVDVVDISDIPATTRGIALVERATLDPTIDDAAVPVRVDRQDRSKVLVVASP